MPTRFRDLASSNLGSLTGNKNKNIIRYNASSGQFETIDIDTLTGLTTNVPDSLVDIIEQNIDLTNISSVTYDGGAF